MNAVDQSFVDMTEQLEHQRRNLMHSVLLLSGIGSVVALSAVLMLGWTGLVSGLLMVAAVFALAPRIPPETVMQLYKAEHVNPHNQQQLAGIMQELAARAELPAVPQLYVIPSLMLNAFATGTRNHAAIAITEGMLRKLTLREVTGVLAHEMSHIRNNDLWVMSLADVMTRVTQLLSYMALFLAMLNVFGLLTGEHYVSWIAVALLYLAPALSSMLQLGLSRAREYDADLDGVLLTGDPMGLASALSRVERYTGAFWEDFMYPVPGRRVPHPSVLRSHPDTNDRVKRLMSVDIRSKYPPIAVVEEPMISMIGVGPMGMRPGYRWPGIWF